MCNSDQLIQIGTEQIRKKEIFMHFPYCIFTLLLGAILEDNSPKKYKNPTFQLTGAVI